MFSLLCCVCVFVWLVFIWSYVKFPLFRFQKPLRFVPFCLLLYEQYMVSTGGERVSLPVGARSGALRSSAATVSTRASFCASPRAICARWLVFGCSAPASARAGSSRARSFCAPAGSSDARSFCARWLRYRRCPTDARSFYQFLRSAVATVFRPAAELDTCRLGLTWTAGPLRVFQRAEFLRELTCAESVPK